MILRMGRACGEGEAPAEPPKGPTVSPFRLRGSVGLPITVFLRRGWSLADSAFPGWSLGTR